MNMSVYIKEPFALQSDWILSKCGEEIASIPQKIVKNLRNFHIIGVEFLYHNYKKGLKGSILNQESGMNFPLQITAFLSAVFKGGCVLIICPDSRIPQWHYHLAEHGNWTSVQINDNTSRPQDCPVHIFGFSHLKQVDLDCDYFCVIVDKFDEIANKLMFKKLRGNFNIGLSQRNFYLNPDQKLKWAMLNWSNPGCAGKLRDFYEIDGDNFENFRDNYRFWWSRLTWQFCDSFQKPTETEINEYQKIITEWPHHSGSAKTADKRKTVAKTSVPRKKTKENSAKKPKKNSVPEKLIEPKSGKSFQSNRENGNLQEKSPDYVRLRNMDENPILTSIIKNFETSPESIQHSSYLSQNSHSRSSNVILSIIENENQPCTSRTMLKSDSDDFLMELATCSQNGKANLNDEDIQKILQETDALLQN